MARIATVRAKVQDFAEKYQDDKIMTFTANQALNMLDACNRFLVKHGDSYIDTANSITSNVELLVSQTLEQTQEKYNMLAQKIKDSAAYLKERAQALLDRMKAAGAKVKAAVVNSILKTLMKLDSFLMKRMEKNDIDSKVYKVSDFIHRQVERVIAKLESKKPDEPLDDGDDAGLKEAEAAADAAADSVGRMRRAIDPKVSEQLMADLRKSSEAELNKLLVEYQAKYDAAKAGQDTEAMLYSHAVIRLIKSLLYHMKRTVDMSVDVQRNALEKIQRTAHYLEDQLIRAESRDFADKLSQGIEILSLVAVRSDQLVDCIHDVAANMKEKGYDDVSEHLTTLATAIADAKTKSADFMSRVDKEGRKVILVRVEGVLDITNTALDIIDKIPFVTVPKTAEVKKVISALQGLVSAFKGDEPSKGDQQALEELLSITGVPDVIKATRAGLRFISKILKAVGAGESKINQLIKSTVKVMDATLAVYADAISKAGDTVQTSWKEIGNNVKDKFLKLFKK